MGRLGKVTGAEEKRATGNRGDGGKQADRVGAGRQKVRGRGVLMAVCRAGLGGMQGVVGEERLDACGWTDGGRNGGVDGVMERGGR